METQMDLITFVDHHRIKIEQRLDTIVRRIKKFRNLINSSVTAEMLRC